jgi:hypothetical protein
MNLGEYVQELPQVKREQVQGHAIPAKVAQLRVPPERLLMGDPTDALLQLYKSPWVCQALQRSLPPLAQQYVLNLLFFDRSIDCGEIRPAQSMLCSGPSAVRPAAASRGEARRSVAIERQPLDPRALDRSLAAGKWGRKPHPPARRRREHEPMGGADRQEAAR